MNIKSLWRRITNLFQPADLPDRATREEIMRLGKVLAELDKPIPTRDFSSRTKEEEELIASIGLAAIALTHKKPQVQQQQQPQVLEDTDTES